VAAHDSAGYSAAAEILGAVLYAQAAPPRTAKPVYWGITAGCGALLRRSST